MYRCYLILLGLSLAFVSQPRCIAEESVFSGPQVGESLGGFQVTGVYDAMAGKGIDPIERAGDAPTLLIFVHRLTRPGIALTRSLSSYAKSLHESGVMSAVVWLDDDQASAKEFLRRARKSLNLIVPVGVSVDGGEGPGAYGLNRNVELTILVAKEKKVVANFAIVQPSMSEAFQIASEVAKTVGKPAPTQEKLMALAYPGQAAGDGGKMRMRRDGGAPRGTPAKETQSATETEPDKESKR